MNVNLRDEVRRILLEEWDPSNAARVEAAHGTYDSYISPILDLIQSGADEDSIIDFLRERERESMCFPGLDRGPLRRVARRLVNLRDQ